jgi:hypothetical protein
LICQPLPKATAADVFSGKIDEVAMSIRDGFFLAGGGKS